MTPRASLIAGGHDVYAAAMLDMAGCARKRFLALRVMNWAVVAREAGAVGRFRGERVGLLHVTGGALSFENGVSPGHLAAGIHAMIA